MPATEQTWRDQKVLHIVFAVMGVTMLIATIWMFAADHVREWKDYQRTARSIDNQMTAWRLQEVNSAENQRARAEIETALAAAKASAIEADMLQQFQDEIVRDAQLRADTPEETEAAITRWRPQFEEWNAMQKELATAAEAAAKARGKSATAEDALEGARQALTEARSALEQARSEGAAAEELASAQKAVEAAEKAKTKAAEDASDAAHNATQANAEAEEKRAELLADLETVIDDAQLRESNLLTARKFKAADYDAARAKLSLLVRDNRPEEFDNVQAEIDQVKAELDDLTLARQAATLHTQRLKETYGQMTAPVEDLQKQLTDNLAEYNRLKSALEERRSTYFGQYGAPGKKFLELPILDAFNSPLKIDNLWTDGLTQPVGSFGQVRRFDRCTTCHQHMEKTMPGSAVEPLYQTERTLDFTLFSPDEAPETELDDDGNPLPLTLENVYGLTIAAQGLLDADDATVDFLVAESFAAKAKLNKASEVDFQDGLQVGDVIVAINGDVVEYPAQVAQFLLEGIDWGESFQVKVRRGLPHPYSTHPRLDLFVGSLSPHKLSVVGCTVCHEGQGSATEFKWVSHTPNTPEEARQWADEHGWFNNHHWIYPMFPARFAESSCLKCHHRVDELAPSETFPDPPAPKLMAGYHLIQRYACFGCHEINGYESADKTLGPDMRLEPNFYAAALALQADPGFEELPSEQQMWAEVLAKSPENTAVRHALRDMLLVDASADEPVLSSDSHKLEEVLKDVEIPGTFRKSGPSLRYVASKLGEPFLYDWIEKPKRFRPSTRMPQFFGHMDHLAADLQQRAAQAIQEIATNSQVEGVPGGADIVRLAKSLADHEDHALPFDARDDLRQRLLQARDALVGRSGSNVADAGNIGRLNAWAGALVDAAEIYEPVEVLGMVRYLLDKSQPFEFIEPDNGYGQQDDEQIERGKLAFEIRGCLSCHSHADFPAGNSNFGPDLTNVGDKLRAESGAENGQQWLYSWITLPSHYSARSRMPDLFLTPEVDADGNVVDPAADITAYLLASSNGWTPKELPEIPIRDLDQFVLANLSQTFPQVQAEQYLVTGIPEEMRDSLKGAEVELVGEMNDAKKLQYAGRKAIGKYGCYACHDIPGFENAKPIGTGLADWGRKEPSKLAFLHILEYLHHGHGHHGASGHGASGHGSAATEGGEPTHGSEMDEHLATAAEPFDESFYISQLEQGERTGFLWQKLKEPRSYDYKQTQNKRYDERLRMPLFPLTPEEREAVATFVLGLVAEPPAKQFLYQPDERQLAIVEGRKVLDKYNCQGCHILRPEKWYLEMEPGLLEEPSDVDDYPFVKAHFAEADLLTSAETDQRRGTVKAVLEGLPALSDDTGEVMIWDIDFENVEADEVGDFAPDELYYPFELWRPAAIDGMVFDVGVSKVPVPATAIKKRVPAWGGDLTWLLLPRVVELEQEVNPAAKGGEALGWLPPPLIGQGEKVQPEWMHSFLLDPHPIRPAVFLRMPKFNMSEEDATKLVNFFAARDNADYPFAFDARTRQQHLMEADARVKSAGSGSAGEGESPGHLESAMQIVTSSDYCIKCHLVGDFVPAGSDRAKAPNLADVQTRLRPKYLRNWIANPKKILPYTSMPVNIAFDSTDENHFGGVSQELYPGTSVEQLDALVDLLLNYDTYLEQQTDISALVQQAAGTGAGGEDAATEGAEADSEAGADGSSDGSGTDEETAEDTTETQPAADNAS